MKIAGNILFKGLWLKNARFHSKPAQPPLKADLATTTTQNEKSKPRFVVYDPAVVLVKVFEIF
jgi:hypothetical protein